jgi:WD40 repeat protein
VRYSPDDETVAVGYGDGNIRLYKTTTGKMLTMMCPIYSPDKMPVTCLR